jgi:hypothetical protein
LGIAAIDRSKHAGGVGRGGCAGRRLCDGRGSLTIVWVDVKRTAARFTIRYRWLRGVVSVEEFLWTLRAVKRSRIHPAE